MATIAAFLIVKAIVVSLLTVIISYLTIGLFTGPNH